MDIDIKRLTEVLPFFSGDSHKTIDTKNLDIAATLASMSVKMLDAMSTIYQMHHNMVRLGGNLDTIVAALSNHTRDTEGSLQGLKMRIEDLERMVASEIKDRS